MFHFLLVFIGGGLGASARHGVGLLVLRQMGPGFPVATLAVNVIGSLLMGLFIGWLVAREAGASADLRLLVATGFLGGFTTFSAFSLDFANLWRAGQIGSAFTYAALSVILSLIAIFAGLAIMRGSQV